jgi:polyisoprenoid-binding protein YceI
MLDSVRRHRLVVVLASLVVAVAFAAPALAQDQYKIDPVHSSIIFKSQHLQTSYVFGRFDKFSGTITDSESDPSKTAINVSVDVASINTGNEKRDGHLKSPDFFSAQEFPQITFKSTSVKAGDGGKMEINGDLTLHGQTKPVTATLQRVGASSNPPPFGQRVGYFATFTVKRSDFGMSKMIPMVGDEVELMVAFEASKGA